MIAGRNRRAGRLWGVPAVLMTALVGCTPTDDSRIERPDAARPEAARQTFEVLKTLEGVWEGEVDRPGSGIPVRLEYEVAAQGEAVLERMILPDLGPRCLMFTVYYLEDDALRLNHYCAAGNQPQMVLSSGTSTREAKFGFEGIAGLDADEIHVHDGVIRFVGNDEIEAEWRNFGDGEHLHDNRLYLRRVARVDSRPPDQPPGVSGGESPPVAGPSG